MLRMYDMDKSLIMVNNIQPQQAGIRENSYISDVKLAV